MTIKKYKFWVSSSRQFHKEQVVEIEHETHTEEGIHDEYLYPWCEEVFPMFNYTDAFVRYGFDEVKETVDAI